MTNSTQKGMKVSELDESRFARTGSSGENLILNDFTILVISFTSVGLNLDKT